MTEISLQPGMVVRTKSIRAIIGKDEGYLDIKPAGRGNQMHFLYLGNDSIKDENDKLDPLKILQILGWDMSPELKAQFEEDKKKNAG